MLGKWTVRWLKKIDPELRLLYAARLFWISIVLGIFCTAFLCDSWFERVLMAISWGAITITCVDIIVTADVRASNE